LAISLYFVLRRQSKRHDAVGTAKILQIRRYDIQLKRESVFQRQQPGQPAVHCYMITGLPRTWLSGNVGWGLGLCSLKSTSSSACCEKWRMKCEPPAVCATGSISRKTRLDSDCVHQINSLPPPTCCNCGTPTQELCRVAQRALTGAGSLLHSKYRVPLHR
jgi:hypothetical protein